jgi:bifunctional non-homologous end joining protein LigD
MEDATLVHVGRVGTGFTATIAHDLWALLDPIRRKDPPFATKVPPEAAKGVRWTEPTYVAEVEFRGWTGEGAVRQASFKGLLEDYDPATVQRQATKRDGAVEAPMPRFHLTHADRVLWPDTGLTKEGLAGFYAEIASYVLPHIAGRPLSLMRCPEGIARDCFYQKHAWAGMSAAVAKHTLGEDEALVIADLEGVGARGWSRPSIRTG